MTRRTLVASGSRARGRLGALARWWIAAQDGVAAVEFALIVPIMSALFIGAIEMSQAITADRHVANVAASIGDLVARSNPSGANTIKDTDIADFMDVGSYLMPPFPAGPLSVQVQAISSTSTSATTLVVEWQCSYAGSTPNTVTCTCPYTPVTASTPGNANNLISNLIVTTSDAVVLTTVTYKYTPPIFDVYMKTGFGNESNGAYTMTDTVYTKPRSALLPLTNNGTLCALH